MFLVGLVLRLYLVEVAPPLTDIYYYNTQAAQLILQGASPYGHQFTGVPSQLATPGAANVFTYLPFTAVYFVPFYLLGDVRFGIIAADMVIGLCLFQFRRRWSLLASASFLLIPFSTHYINDLVPAVMFVVVSVALEARGRRLSSALSLGLALATSVLVWLLVPFIVYRFVRRREMRPLMVVFATFAAVCAPFFIANPVTLLYDVLVFQFGRQTTPLLTFGGTFPITLNASLSGIVLAMTGQPAPILVRVILTLALLGACLVLRLPERIEKIQGNGEAGLSLPSLLFRSAVFTAGAVILLPSVLFLIYFELALVLLLCWAAMLDGRRQPADL